MGIVFFKRNIHKQFDFKNRYYDPDKEARDLRKRRAEADKDSFVKEDFRAELQYRWSLNRASNLPTNQRYTNIRRMLVLLLIAAIIVVIMYLLGMYLVTN